MARTGWGKHSITATGADSGDQVSVNAWNANTNQSGILGFTKQSGTIASNAILVSDSLIEVQADGTLNILTPTDNNEFDVIYLIAKSTATAVTVTHDASAGAGKIRLLAGVNKTLSVTSPTILICRTIGANKEWVEYGGGTTNALDDVGDVTITSNASGEILKWNGTAWINNTLAEANIQPIVTNVSDTEIGYLDGVTSAIQTQINTKVTTSGALGTPSSGALTNCTGFPVTLAGSEALTNKTYNGNTITSGTGTLTLTTGSTLITSATNSITLTSTGATNVTLPTTGTLSTLAGAETLDGKTLTAVVRIQNALATALGTTGTIDLDFSTGELTTMPAMTGNVTFTASNYAAGRSKTIRIIGGASAFTFVFPPAWKFLGAAAPASLAIGKYAVLTLTSISTTEAEVVAAYSAQV